MEDKINNALNEQPLQPTAANENNPTDLDTNDQPSAAGSVAQPEAIGLLDLPTKATPEEKANALKVLAEAGIVDADGNPNPDVSTPSDPAIGCRKMPQALLRCLLTAGFIPAVVNENREIHSNNLNLLEGNLSDTGSNIFDEPAKAAWAKRVLEEGKSLMTFDGRVIAADDPDIWKYFVILDGQHRTVVCILNLEYNLWVEFAQFSGSVMDYVGRLNNVRKGWDGIDIRHAVVEKHGNKVSILEEIDKYKDYFGVTDKYAEKALTRKEDQFRRQELNEIQLGKRQPEAKYICDENKKAVGWNISFATLIAAKGDKEALKLVKRIGYLQAIYNIVDYLHKEDEKRDFELNISTFIAKLDGTQLEKIKKHLKANHIDDLKVYLHKQYISFVENHKNDIAELREENKEVIDSKAQEIAEANSASKSIPVVKLGSPDEVIKNRQVIANQKVQKEADKLAKQKQKEADKLAKQKQKEADKAAKEAAKAAKAAPNAVATE